MSDTKDRIRQVMVWAQMTQQEFAAKINVSPASLSSIFSGRTRPTNMYIVSIHNAFPQINVNWLLFGEGDMLNVPSAQNASEAPAANETDIETDLFTAVDAFNTTFGTKSGSRVVGLAREEDLPLVAQAKTGAAGNATTPYSTRTTHHRQAKVGSLQATSLSQDSNLSNAYSDAQETNNNFDKPQRKVTEIRIFYDNGTYESFFPPKK